MSVLSDTPIRNHYVKTHYPALADSFSPEISGSFVMLAFFFFKAILLELCWGILVEQRPEGSLGGEAGG